MTVRETIWRESANFTASGRKIGNAILADYPFGALRTIQELAERTGVSAPSITRFVSKIGFAGYQEFQRQLIAELRESGRSPLELKTTEKLHNGSAFLIDYASRAAQRLQEMGERIPQEQFDRILTLVADPNRHIFVVGGRASGNIALLLSTHLKQIRSEVHHLPNDVEDWPYFLLAMRRNDVFIMFDFRRYQRDLVSLAEVVANNRKLSIILITDKWMSPIARHCDHIIALPSEIETAWDTLVCATAFVEALIVKVSEADWPSTRKRLEAWDQLRMVRPTQPLMEK
ncbi:MurR/RpiR family transcriptional regulator [Mesorhizobium intechi]|uniref:MurR/RpiR family transcriptional regulator n=1 Tax=Mesorhizobium intechi TaxID=537601 RepID=A0A8T9AQU6_9HYPH|nr:MurR/RpiR family transcriptional regulator [Mesorhizobium intechi]TSE09304.1 MurR/RpiR family transcriptional regulator [Mesorhizobium intechi]